MPTVPLKPLKLNSTKSWVERLGVPVEPIDDGVPLELTLPVQ